MILSCAYSIQRLVIHRNHAYDEMRRAAEQLRGDYENDPQLTEMTALDSEDLFSWIEEKSGPICVNRQVYPQNWGDHSG
jgi:hypothetical protein